MPDCEFRLAGADNTIVLNSLPGGWAIPIGIMFVLSFPPLFGNEIVHVLCGIVWGLWIGFGIVCAGTFIGEIGNFYAFRYCCQSRGDKLEKQSLVYATLAKVVRDGGFIVSTPLLANDARSWTASLTTPSTLHRLRSSSVSA